MTATGGAAPMFSPPLGMYGWKGKGMMGGAAPPLEDFHMPLVADQANLPMGILDNFRGKKGRNKGKGGFDDWGAKPKGKGKGKNRKPEEDHLPDTAFLQKLHNQEPEVPDNVPCEYQRDFRSYSREQIREICGAMKSNEMPAALKAEGPHTDLIAKEPEGWAAEPDEKGKGKGKSPQVGPKK
jgi:hypothetical protein